MKTLATILIFSIIISAICGGMNNDGHHEFQNAIGLVSDFAAVVAFGGFIISFLIITFHKRKK